MLLVLKCVSRGDVIVMVRVTNVSEYPTQSIQLSLIITCPKTSILFLIPGTMTRPAGGTR